MAGFQLAGPAAEVSKILYGENRKSYQSPNAQYNNSDVPQCSTVMVQYVVHRVGPRPPIPVLDSTSSHQSGRNYTVRLGSGTICDFHHTKNLDTSAAGPAS